MKIGIIGTRGIPNYYGGFEQFAEYFAAFLVQQGEEVIVYASHDHPFKEPSFKGARIIRCYDPEKHLGTAGQFVYDLNCIRDARKRGFDVILQLGYTSSTIWHRLMPKKATVFTNMDGLEWKRSKYSRLVRRFLKYAEGLGVKGSQYLIADSPGIQQHLQDSYGAPSRYIPYGAELFKDPDVSTLAPHGLQPGAYDLLIARMEPENNIEVILDGVVAQGGRNPFLVIGNQKATSFGRRLEQKYSGASYIRFLGGIYDIGLLNNLRHFSRYYFHGHSVGGTNPSLLEAMASQALIAAHDNVFNRAVLEEDAFYFLSVEEVKALLDRDPDPGQRKRYTNNNSGKISSRFNWEVVNRAYLDFFREVLQAKRPLSEAEIKKGYLQ